MAKKNTTCIIIGLVGAFIGLIAIIVLALIAIPMYTSFQQSIKAGQAMKIAKGGEKPIGDFYRKHGDLSSIYLQDLSLYARDENGEPISVGYGLATFEGVSWNLTAQQNALQIRWDFDTPGCGELSCSGIFCIYCQDNLCLVATATAKSNRPASLNNNPHQLDCQY